MQNIPNYNGYAIRHDEQGGYITRRVCDGKTCRHFCELEEVRLWIDAQLDGRQL